MTQPTLFHTCPMCDATLHINGALQAWITPDGRLILETSTPRPSDHRWLELVPGAQNWLAELLRVAHERAQTHRSTH